MPSQLQSLKESLKTLEPQFGKDNPFVQGLKMQIARYEKPLSDNPVEMYSVGMRAEPNQPQDSTNSPKYQPPSTPL